jgi:tetratricopeptide (TPR) repeat protein
VLECYLNDLMPTKVLGFLAESQVIIPLRYWHLAFHRDGLVIPRKFFQRIEKSDGSYCRGLVRLLVAAYIVLVLHVSSNLCPANAQAPPPDRRLARSYFTSAQRALAAGDTSTAIAKLNQAVQADASYAEAYLLLGLTEFHNGQTATSIEHYKRALQLQPKSYAGHYNLALAYLRDHKLEEGRAQLEQALELGPNQADAAYDLGVVLLEQGRPAAALNHLIRAKKLNPQRPDVAFNIVRAKLEAGKVADARSEAQAAAQRLGSDPQWNTAVGQLFVKHAQPKEAAIYLRKANALNPENTEIRDQLALAYLQSGQPGQVLDLIAEPKTGDDHYLRGSAYYLDHRFEEADRESGAALALAPDDPHILVLRTRLLQRAGQQDAAIEMAQKAISLAPDWDEPFYLAGVSLYFVARFPEAEKNLARALQLNSNSTRTLFMEAVTLVSLGNSAEAEQLLHRAIALEPGIARFHCHLGILLARRNQNVEAEASFRKAIELAPNYALSHYEMGKLLVQSNRLAAAAEELSQAVKYEPNLSAAYYQLSRVYARLGDAEKSKSILAEFEKLHQREMSDSQALEDDTRKATE